MIHTSISDSGSIPLSSINGAAMASTGYQASDWSLLGQSKTITANNIVSFSRQTAPVAAWSFRRWGQVSLINQLIHEACKGLTLYPAAEVSKSQKIVKNKKITTEEEEEEEEEELSNNKKEI